MALRSGFFATCLVGVLAVVIYIAFQTSTVRFENHIFIKAEIPDVYEVFADPQLLSRFHDLVVDMDTVDFSEKEEDGHIVRRFSVVEFVPALFGYNVTIKVNVTSELLRNEVRSNVTLASPLNLMSFDVSCRFRFMETQRNGGETVTTHVQNVCQYEMWRIFQRFTEKTGRESHQSLLANVKEYLESRDKKDSPIEGQFAEELKGEKNAGDN